MCTSPPNGQTGTPRREASRGCPAPDQEIRSLRRTWGPPLNRISARLRDGQRAVDDDRSMLRERYVTPGPIRFCQFSLFGKTGSCDAARVQMLPIAHLTIADLGQPRRSVTISRVSSSWLRRNRAHWHLSGITDLSGITGVCRAMSMIGNRSSRWSNGSSPAYSKLRPLCGSRVRLTAPPEQHVEPASARLRADHFNSAGDSY
jgi:hypothetical protein